MAIFPSKLCKVSSGKEKVRGQLSENICIIIYPDLEFLRGYAKLVET